MHKKFLVALLVMLSSYFVSAKNSPCIIINSQSLSQTVCSGTNLVLSVTTSSSNTLPILYQWYRNNVAVSGATAASYTLSVSSSNSGTYTCMAYNNCGQATSQPMVINVNTITISSLIGGGKICAGSPATFNVVASGTNLTYQWTFNGANISGANSSTYTINNSSIANSGVYTCVVSNNCGSQTKKPVSLIVCNPLVITGQSTNQTVFSGDPLHLAVTVNASACVLSYQWYKKIEDCNGETEQLLEGKTTSSIDISACNFTNAGKYFCRVYGVCGEFQQTNVVQIDVIKSTGLPGTLESSFQLSNQATANNLISSIAIQPDGKIICGGFMSSVWGQAANGLCRLNSDGTLDNTFSVSFNQYANIRKVIIQPDGKILAAGTFTTVNGQARKDIVRLNIDGSIDNSFSLGTGFSATYQAGITSIALQCDNKIIAVGYFETCQGHQALSVCRLLPDGSFDGSFTSNLLPITTWLYDIIVTDDAIFIAGGLVQYAGITSYGIMKLNYDGTPYAGFSQPIAVFSVIYSIDLQNDGKILLGGSMSANSLNLYGQSYNGVIRLLPNGAIDPDLHSQYGFGNPISTYDPPVIKKVKVQADGKILAGGRFTSYEGVAINRLVRMLPDGSIDPNFSSPFPDHGIVQEIAITQDNQLLVGGSISVLPSNWLYNDIYKLNLKSNNPNGGDIERKLGSVQEPSFNENKDLIVYPNPSNSFITLELPFEANAGLELIDMYGKIIFESNVAKQQSQIDIRDLQIGVYMLRVFTSKETFIKQVVKQ